MLDMFFADKLILYLKRTALEVYNERQEGYLGRLEFPEDTARDEEIVSEPKFEELITSFLTKLPLKEKKALIILSDEVIFTKTIPISDEKTEAKLAQDFFSKVPFDVQKQAQKIVKTKNGVNLVAVNKNLFLAPVAVLSKLQKETEAVVPATLFGITQTASALSKKDLSKVTSSQETIEVSNFLKDLVLQNEASTSTTSKEETQKDIVQNPQEESHTKSNYFVPVGIIIIILGAAFAFYLYKKPNLKNFSLKLPSISLPGKKAASDSQQSAPPSSTEQPGEPSPSGQAASPAKDQISIQVLNGTGQEGQASKVKLALEDIGFSQIETGNATTQNSTTTTVDFSQKVANDTRQEIVTELEKTFANIKMNAGKTQDFDVIITTGPEK